MLNCKQASHLLSDAQDRGLDWREQLPLRWHLVWCDGCRNFREQLGFLRLATRRFPGRDENKPQD